MLSNSIKLSIFYPIFVRKINEFNERKEYKNFVLYDIMRKN